MTAAARPAAPPAWSMATAAGRGPLLAVIASLAAAAALAPVAAVNYLLFHVLVELYAVVVGLCIGLVAAATWRFGRNRFLAVLAGGYVWVALVDLGHTLSYQGMGVFPGVGANTATQLWLIGRVVEAGLLAAAPLALVRRVPPGAGFFGAGAAAAAGVLLLAAGAMPVAWAAGSGLTAFKVGVEYAIVALLAGALLHLWHRRAALDAGMFRLLAAAIALTAAQELAFTLYADVYGIANAIGHILKFLSFCLVFAALVLKALVEPFALLARSATSYEAVPYPVLLVDRAGTIRQANRAGRAGIEPADGDPVGRPLHAHLHGTMAGEDACAACTAVRAGRRLPPSLVRLDQSGRWIELSVTPVAALGTVAGAVVVEKDVTAAVAAEQRVARREAELRSRFEGTSAVQLEVDPETATVLDANPAAARFYGLPLGRLRGLPAARLRAPSDAVDAGGGAEREGAADLAAAACGPHRYEARHRGADGRARDVEVFAGPIARDDRTLVFAIVHEISERKDAERRLIAEKDRAERASAAKSTFLELMSHELRTPLNAIEGFAQAMQMELFGPLGDPHYGEYAAGIGAAGRRLEQLLSAILDLVALESDGALDRERIDLARLAAEALGRAAPAAAAAGVRLCPPAGDAAEAGGVATAADGPARAATATAAGAPDTPARRAGPGGGAVRIDDIPAAAVPGPAVAGDRRLLARLLDDLVGNAVQYAGAGSTVTLSLAGAGRRVHLAIRDDGPGMTAEQVAAALQPFGATPDPMVSRRAGSGLGLPLAARIARAHGGRLSIDSAVGTGTRVQIELPLADTPPAVA